VSEEFPSAFNELGFGSRIAGYRLEEQIGQGGMAVVYRAYDPRLDRRVALKILAPALAQDEAFQRRFIRESRAAAAVDHPNIIPVFEAGESGGVLFIAMRFVHGGDVRRLLDALGPLPPARVADIVSQVASALDAAHARGLVHRDVKPGNMLLDQAAGSGHQDHVYLSDFGLSKQALAQTALTSQGQFLGTLDYIAPEQVEGHLVDGRADLYALACAAFELLSGAPPFRGGEGLAVVWAKLSEPPPPLTERRPDLPHTVDWVMKRALAKAPADRFAGCGEFAAALREGLGLRSADTGARIRPPVPRAATEIAMPAVGLSGPPASPESPPSPATSIVDVPAASSAPPATSIVDVPAASSAPAGSPAPSAAGPAAPAESAAPPMSSGPPTSAGPYSVPPAPSESSGTASASGPPAPNVSAGPKTEAARIPGPQPTRPGLTEPTPPVSPWPGSPGGPWPGTADYRSSPGYSASRDYRSPSGDYRSSSGRPSPRDYRETSGASSWPGGPGGAGTVIAPPAPRPSWWRSPAFMATGAVVVVIGVAAAAFAALHHGGTGSGGGGTSGGAVAAPIKPPGCNSASATGKTIPGVHSEPVALGGNPFGVVVTPDGKYSFVARGNSIAVLKDNGGSAAPTQIASVPAPGAAKNEAITSDGKYLLAVTGSSAYVIDAIKAEDGAGSGAVLGTLAGPAGNTSNDVLVSYDNKFAFITFQNDGDVAVFNLQQAIAGGLGHSGFKGFVQLGPESEPQGMAESPDGHWLFVTGESQDGRLYVVDMNKAETDPQHAVKSSAAAGCGAARVIVSADGSDVWVTDRDSNALVAFSASELINDPKRALIAKLDVGQNPLGLAFVKGGSEILVADANLHKPAGADNLALISTQMALQGKTGALRGYITTGRVPRELAAEPGGHTILSTDYGSGQMQAIEVGSLP
jgi:serine/threonine protein kinase